MYRAVLNASFALTILTLSPAASAQFSQTGIIYNPHTNQCLQPLSDSAGAPIVQEPCSGAFLQQWTAWAAPGNIVQFQAGSALWLDARGGAANGTPVVQWTYGNISNENWQTGPAGKDGIPTLISRVSGTNKYCLDVPGGQTTPGLAMQIYQCNGTISQEWYITAPLIQVAPHQLPKKE